MQTITERSARARVGLCLALLAACGPAPAARSPTSEDSVSATVAGARATLHIVRASRQFELAAPLDEMVAPNSAPMRVEVVGWTATAVIVADSYASLSPGMSMCQAGQERFLRVIALSHERATLAFTTKLESCRENIELAEPLSFSADGRSLSASWLEPHPKSQKAELVVRFDETGAPLAP